ncbi:hypothetical protein DCC62_09670 [candidate division KSB1 bacterium]|nr:MAG: hypothetical protein DCC62_09670 [candidate division KSB1 bacterium]
MRLALITASQSKCPKQSRAFLPGDEKMKLISKIAVVMLFLFSPAWGQAAKDTSVTRFEKEMKADTSKPGIEQKTAADSSAKAGAKQNSRKGRFRDENGNGIDDRREMPGNGRGHSRDKFVDADGDGICDGREAGLGFQRGQGGSIKSGNDAGGHGKQRQQRGKP